MMEIKSKLNQNVDGTTWTHRAPKGHSGDVQDSQGLVEEVGGPSATAVLNNHKLVHFRNPFYSTGCLKKTLHLVFLEFVWVQICWNPFER